MAKIQIHRAGLKVSASDSEIEAISRRFQRRQALVLESFLEPGLLAQVQDAAASAQFAPRRYDHVGSELCMTGESLAVQMLLLLTNSPQLFGLVQRITRCPQVGYFDGRIYRIPPGPASLDQWHRDLTDGRQVAMSINLGAEPYQGGLFELRKGGKSLFRVANTGPGDALIFRIRHDLEHRVTAVGGTAPKTAFAGWFLDQNRRQAYLGFFRGRVSSKIVRC